MEQNNKPVKQEPVAWAHPNGGYLSDIYIKEFATGMEKANYNIPLYAAPVSAKREWVDLTDDEIEECVHIADSECTEDACMPWFVEFARAVIAADREKNK